MFKKFFLFFAIFTAGCTLFIFHQSSMNDAAVEYQSRGFTKILLGDYQGAIADSNQAISINPSYGKAYLTRGIAKSYLGDKQGKIKDITKAKEIFREQGNKDGENASSNILSGKYDKYVGQ